MEITYEDLLQSEQILVRSKSLTDEQLQCLSAVERQSPHPIVTYEHADVAKRNYELQHERGRSDAMEWLKARGLLASLPSYDGGSESISDFARRIEQFCGIEPGSLLSLHELGILTIKPEWAESQLRGAATVSEDKFWCLMNALSASNLEEHGVRFGFIVNEAYSSDDQQK